MKTCRHCGKVLGTPRARDLCNPCWSKPAVRNLYPVSGRGPKLDDFNGGYQQPDEPTDARPGSAAKVAAMMARVKAKRSLHHEQDVNLAGKVQP